MLSIWGANTGVGKTLVSAGLAAAAQRATRSCLFLKPVQTGFPSDSDADKVAGAAGGVHRLGTHAMQIALDHAAHAAAAAASRIDCCTLFAWQQPISPHLAVQREGRAAPDADVLAAIRAELTAGAAAELVLLETAGGVASPAPSGTLQCDLLAPLGLPALLVGDGRLGGISATICAYESLRARGMSVEAVVLLDGGLENHLSLSEHLEAPVVHLPMIGDEQALSAWLDMENVLAPFDGLVERARQRAR